MIRFQCPGCQATYTVGDEKAGKQGKCPKCQSAFIIPSADASDFPPPPPPPAPPPPPVSQSVEIAPCPTCGTRLSVDNADVGLNVQCPNCSSTFLAVRPGAVASPPVSSNRNDYDDDRPSRRNQDEDRPSRRRRDYDDEDDYDRPRRRPMRRSEAAAAVAGPAIGLIVATAISLLLLLVGVLFDLALILGLNGGQDPRIAFRLIWGGVMIVTNFIVLLGAIQMKSMRSYSMAMTACILAVIPCLGPCLIMGMPFGIWGLIALNGNGVRRAFD